MRDALIRRFARHGQNTLGSSDAAADDDSPTPGTPVEDGNRPTRLGRFEIVRQLGVGSMGVVYAARDPMLEREVAVKLLRADVASANALARLQREAQALAQISHANVVEVFGIGRHDNDVFVAMALIDGCTLAAWQAEAAPGPEEILAAYLQAARGLSAIHQAGLVHRDFKPANVMRDHAGRVRVLDLGLVRGGSSGRSAGMSADVDSAHVRIDSSATEPNTLLGTPAYMAPEQILAEEATFASDQFSFCVALFEAMYGVRPFQGASHSSFVDAVARGAIEMPPDDTGVSPRVGAALRRGLAREPQHRHASMDALIDALSARSPWRSRLRYGVAAVATLGIGGLVVTQCSAETCGVAEEVDRVWGMEHRVRVEAAMIGTAAPKARESWSQVASVLDGYAATLRADGLAVCVAAQGASSARAACLNSHLAALEGVVGVLSDATGETVAASGRIVGGLPNAQACVETERRDLGHLALPPQARARVAALTALRLTHRADALTMIPSFELAEEAASEALAAAEMSGHAPTLGLALRSRAKFHIAKGDLELARGDLERAYEVLRIARDDEQAIFATIGLIWLGLRAHDLEQAQRWARVAQSQAEATALEQPFLRGQLEQRLGQLAHAQGDADRGEQHLLTALALFESIDDAREIATVLIDLCPVAQSRGDLKAAVEYATRAIDVLGERFGPDELQLATAYQNLGNARQLQGRVALALEAHQACLRLRERKQGPMHPQVAVAAYATATDLLDAGRGDEALVLLARVRAILPAEHPAVVAADLVEGDFALQHGRLDEAQVLYERALLALETKYGSEDPRVATARMSKAKVLQRRGEYSQAVEESGRALADLEATYGPSHPTVGTAAALNAGCLEAAGKTDAAVTMFRRALAIAKTTSGPSAPKVLELETALARALRKSPRNPTRNPTD